jgi:hypothetical protein
LQIADSKTLLPICNLKSAICNAMGRTMTRLPWWLTALALLLAAGLAHGLLAERWRPSGALEQAVARMDRVPLDIGEWQGQPVEVDEAAFAQAGARGYWARAYTNRRGEVVLAVLMCGRAGKMAVHTPEVCYRGAGFDLLGAPASVAVRDEDGEEAARFWTARFAKQGSAGGSLRLYWAWGDGDTWQAPANPRWEFRGRPLLYKLYVSHERAGTGDADPALDFLRQLLPALREHLPASES